MCHATPVLHADLEIRILARREDGYPVEITFSGEQEFPLGRLDPSVLPWVASAAPEEDGDRLFGALFADPRLREAWSLARGQSRSRRIRLRIDPDVPELHALPWELLRETPAGEPSRFLAADPDTPLSRYLAGSWRPGAPVLDRPVRLLAAVANPEGLEEYGLQPLDPAAERRSLEEALEEAAGAEGLEISFLEGPVTLAALEEALRRGPHLLHLVAHGFFNPETGRAAVYLADGEGKVAPVGESELATLFARHGGTLRLVFLACCQSASRSSADAFRGLAPALVCAGVPAVVAMQDLVPVDTARRFAAVFYGRLLGHGMADLAANEARSALLAGGLPGAAIPVAFLRLRNGRLLAFRGQVLGRRASGFWTTLLDNIEDGECTPILGPGVTRRLLPSPADLARSLAGKYGYPFSDADNLPRVAQFVGTLDPTRLRKEVLRSLREGFQRWHGLPVEPGDRRKLSQAIREAGWSELTRETVETEIHHQLADLGLPLYLTTNFDNFMALALEARGRKPRRETLPWRDRGGSAGCTGPHCDLDPPPTAEDPVVLHLFGADEDPISMVLSEDDHLDYLARISRDHEYILPTGVAAALARTTLLLLGYHLHDLDLKVLLRGLLSHLDASQWRRLHVAVQVDARVEEQGAFEEVRRYLEAYFGGSQIDVYWGSTQQFVADLHAHWRERHHA
jgi:hypothetical protein